jgi:hypothetical protein
VSRYDYDPDFARAAPAATPTGAEDRLEAYKTALDEATEAFTEAANAELEAEEDRDAADRKWRLAEECPKPGVRDGMRTTVAYVEAWIADRIQPEERAYRRAKLAREAAEKHLRKVEKQGGFQQSITASVRESYRGTGGYR